MGEKKLKKEATSEEQKAQEAEVKRQRKFVKEVLYPYLLEHSENIEEAKLMLKVGHNALRAAFEHDMVKEQQRRSNEGIYTLDFDKFLRKEKENYSRDRGLVDLFAAEKISIADSLLGGMVNVMEGFIREECTGRKLDTLKTEFLD